MFVTITSSCSSQPPRHARPPHMPVLILIAGHAHQHHQAIPSLHAHHAHHAHLALRTRVLMRHAYTALHPRLLPRCPSLPPPARIHAPPAHSWPPPGTVLSGAAAPRHRAAAPAAARARTARPEACLAPAACVLAATASCHPRHRCRAQWWRRRRRWRWARC
eukprot:364997-Chlamydomonas_euryale.AAC.8